MAASETSLGRPRRRVFGFYLSDWGAMAFLVITTFICVFPFFWAISSSFKSAQEILVGVPKLLPIRPTLINYEYLMGMAGLNYMGMFVNSVYVTCLTVVLNMIICVMAGYGFAKVDFRGRDVIFLFLIIMMFIPQAGGLMALYEMMDKLGLRNSLNGLVLYFSSQVAVGVFVMRQAFLSVPRDIEDSARIDGANTFQLLWNVAVPMARSAILVVSILKFVEVWGEFLITYTLIDDQTKLTAAVGYAAIGMISPSFSQVNLTDLSIWGVNNASAVVLMVPAIVIYVALQKWFVQGMLEGVLKF